MKATRLSRYIITAAVVLLLLALAGAAAAMVMVHPGQRIYREGLLPFDREFTATVQGDIKVKASLFPCVSCHQRSGLGSFEGTVLTLPTNAQKLYQPLTFDRIWQNAGSINSDRPAARSLRKLFGKGLLRPAYDEDTLAESIRNGVASDGRKLDPTMPRYDLDDDGMRLLTDYLRRISYEVPPGITDTEIHVGTVITADADPLKAAAMLTMLKQFVVDLNDKAKLHRIGVRGGWESKEEPRRVVLHVWRVSGPPKGWFKQLDELNRQVPVFALVGGISGSGWGPIHDFCEKRQVPCILPLADAPAEIGNSFYTLYLSRGPGLEAEAVARYLQRELVHNDNRKIVQVVRTGTEGEVRAAAFEKALEQMEFEKPVTISLYATGAMDLKSWEKLLGKENPGALVLWLDDKDLAPLDAIAGRLNGPGSAGTPWIASAELLGYNYDTLPDGLRYRLSYVHPRALPQEERDRAPMVDTWMRWQRVPVIDRDVQYATYLAGWVFWGGLMGVGDDFYREYFLESIDMMTDERFASVLHSRLTFGPGQRIAVKDCAVVKLAVTPQ